MNCMRLTEAAFRGCLGFAGAAAEDSSGGGVSVSG
jgi:hypothetical protein